MIKQASGISMVEIIIATAIGMLLVLGITKLFLSSKQAYRLQDAQARIQENARTSFELLNHDIRLSGYLGCNSASITPQVIAIPPLISPPTPLISGGNDNKGSFNHPNPALNFTPLTNDIIKGSDAITVQFGEACNAWTNSETSKTDLTGLLPSDNSCSIDIGTPLVIASCATSHIFRAATDESQNKLKDNPTSSLGTLYPMSSELLLFRSYTYFLRHNPNNNPSLYRLDNNKDMIGNNPVELVEGIEDMQILYGFDTDSDGSANQYLTADAIEDWKKIVSVRIELTLRSVEDQLTLTTRTYSYDGKSNLTDHRLSKKFTTTIAIRNQIF